MPSPRLRQGGEASILEEFINVDIEADEAAAKMYEEAKKLGWEPAAQRDKDEVGWTDLDWVRYLAGKPAEMKMREFAQLKYPMAEVCHLAARLVTGVHPHVYLSG